MIYKFLHDKLHKCAKIKAEKERTKQMINYIKSVKDEMKAVVWPTAKQNRHDTAVVIFSSAAFAAFLGSLDWLFSMVMEHI